MEYNFYKEDKNSIIWWVDDPEVEGPVLFSFDRKTVFNFFTDFPDKLTKEQIEIFKKENPILAELKNC